MMYFEQIIRVIIGFLIKIMAMLKGGLSFWKYPIFLIKNYSILPVEDLSNIFLMTETEVFHYAEDILRTSYFKRVSEIRAMYLSRFITIPFETLKRAASWYGIELGDLNKKTCKNLENSSDNEKFCESYFKLIEKIEKDEFTYEYNGEYIYALYNTRIDDINYALLEIKEEVEHHKLLKDTSAFAALNVLFWIRRIYRSTCTKFFLTRYNQTVNKNHYLLFTKILIIDAWISYIKYYVSNVLEAYMRWLEILSSNKLEDKEFIRKVKLYRGYNLETEYLEFFINISVKLQGTIHINEKELKENITQIARWLIDPPLDKLLTLGFGKKVGFYNRFKQLGSNLKKFKSKEDLREIMEKVDKDSSKEFEKNLWFTAMLWGYFKGMSLFELIGVLMSTLNPVILKTIILSIISKHITTSIFDKPSIRFYICGKQIACDSLSKVVKHSYNIPGVESTYLSFTQSRMDKVFNYILFLYYRTVFSEGTNKFIEYPKDLIDMIVKWLDLPESYGKIIKRFVSQSYKILHNNLLLHKAPFLKKMGEATPLLHYFIARDLQLNNKKLYQFNNDIINLLKAVSKSTHETISMMKSYSPTDLEVICNFVDAIYIHGL